MRYRVRFLYNIHKCWVIIFYLIHASDNLHKLAYKELVYYYLLFKKLQLLTL